MKSLGFVRRNFLNELLSLPGLMEQVQALPAPRFHEIVQQVGLEDCSELVSMATASQLEELFDLDLWKNISPGEVENFDSKRFILWLEILLEAGEDVVVEKLRDMDAEMLVYALANHLFVLTTESLDRCFRCEDDDARQADILMESCLYEELFDFQVISRNPDSWDTILTTLVALDKNHHDLLWNILDQLAALGSNEVEDESLVTVLSEIESMAENMRDKRETRRGEKGYVASLDARAFLGLADKYRMDELLATTTRRDAVTNAYFRSYNPTAAKRATADSRSVSELAYILRKHLPDTDSDATAGLLTGDTADNQTLLQLALQQINETSPELYQTRIAELSYVGNVISAGCTLNGVRMRDIEASRAAMATCTLGIDVALHRSNDTWSIDYITEIIKQIPMERLFLAGWKSLPRDASSPRDFPYQRRAESTGGVLFHDNLADIPSR